jgi:hypothetical protein
MSNELTAEAEKSSAINEDVSSDLTFDRCGASNGKRTYIPQTLSD